jgi:RHS repeat-associated protein
VGGLLWVLEAPTGPSINAHYAAYDGNGNVMGLVNAADGTWSARYEYGPFGEVIRSTGTMAAANPFRWSTKIQDEDSGLNYYGYRYYSPGVGRWLGRDPIGELPSANLYGFLGNSSLASIDVLGMVDYESKLEPVPDQPDTYKRRRIGTYAIDKCKYVVLIGHGSRHPYEMKGESPCAYGVAYGCFTGGGRWENPSKPGPDRKLPSFVIQDPVLTPGIPGAPAPPSGEEDGLIDSEELIKLANNAFSAAVSHARESVCSKPCECKSLVVEIVCTGPMNDEALRPAKNLCGRREVLRCKK